MAAPKRMKLAVSNIGWAASEDATIAPRLRDAGAEALEVAPGRIFPDVGKATIPEAQAVATHWAGQGLPIVSMQALLFGQPDLRLFGSAGDEHAFETYLGHVMGLAGALGCGPLVFGSPGNRKRGTLTPAEAQTRAAPLLRRIGAKACATGTRFCLEANAAEYGCDFMTRLEEAAAMVKEVDHPGVGMILDTGNMMMAKEPPEAVRPILPLIRHVHISAPHLGPVNAHPEFVRAIFAELRKADYSGHVALEMRPDPSGLDPLLDSLALLRTCMDEAQA